MKSSAGITLSLLIILRTISTQSATEDENNTGKVLCNQHFMRSYMLKGREHSTKDDRLHLCSNVVHNCCLKVDQQRIFHYVKTVLPMRLNEHRDRIKMAFEKLKKLHRHILRTQIDFPGSEQRQRYCRRQRRLWESYNMVELDDKFEEFYAGFYERASMNYQRFYCSVCDGWAHSFIRKTAGDNTWSVIMDQKSCMDFVQSGSEEIKFWNVDLLNYLKLLQNVVDCTHYTHSFNLTFYNERVQESADQALDCLKAFGPERINVCKPICQRFSISNLMPWMDGDSAFLMNTVNFFERFFKNREVGEFISIEMRSFYKRFETLKTLTPVQENDFVKMIIDKTHPVLRREDPLQELNQGLQREAVKSFRQLGQQSTPGNSDSIPSPLKLTPDPSYPYADTPDLIPNLMGTLPPNRRLLQGVNKHSQKVKADIRSPKAETDSDMAKTYDLIGLSSPYQGDYVFKYFVELLNLDKVEKLLAIGEGLRLNKYESTKFSMTETDFYKKLFKFRQRDKYIPQLESLVGDFTKPFIVGVNACATSYYKVDRSNYREESPASRRLRLVPNGASDVKAKTIKKN